MRINFQAAVEYKGNIYFSAISMNGLFVFDPYNEETRYLCSFKEKGYSTLHRMAFINNDDAWFLPQFGRNIICINLQTLQQTVYTIPGTENLDESIMLYPEAIVHAGHIYATPRGIRTMAIIDMEKHRVRFLDDFLPEDNDVLSIAGVQNNKIYYYSKNNTNTIVLDTRDDSFSIVKSEAFENCNLSYIDDDVFFISKNVEGECYINDEYINYKLAKDFSRITRLNNKLIIFPAKESYLVIVDLNSKKVIEINASGDVAKKNEIDIFLPITGLDSNYFVSVFLALIFSINDNSLICKKVEISERDYEVSKMKSMQYRDKVEKMEYHEGDIIFLQDYLNSIC